MGITIKATPVFKALKEAYDTKKYRGFLLAGGSRCFAKGTMVRMADNSLKAIEDIMINDKVKCLDGDGDVIETTNGYDKLYKVKQENGIDYIVNSSHILTLIENGKIHDIEILDFIDRKPNYKGFKQNGEETEITVEEYGDGEYYGFRLKDNAYFLLEDDTVVHNSSKSWSIIQLILVYCQENAYKKKNILIARQRYSDLKDTIMRDFFDMLEEYGMYKEEFHTRSHPQSYTHLGNTIYFRGLDAKGAHGEKRNVVWINEAFETEQDAFRQLNQRLTDFFIMDYNPCFTEHWILDSVRSRPDVFFHHSTMLDNPFLPEAVRNEILAYDPSNPVNVRNGTACDWHWQVYGLGIGAQLEGIIFPYVTWIDKFPEHLEYWFGEDWGFTVDPLAIVQTAIEGDNIYFWERCYEPIDNPQAVSEMMHAIGIERFRPIIADSSDKYSSAKGTVEMVKDLRAMGWNVTKVRKTKEKIYWIHKLKEYKIHIVNTVNFRKEQQMYRWKSINGIQVNQPMDKYNHLWDAALYSLMGMKDRKKKRFW